MKNWELLSIYMSPSCDTNMNENGGQDYSVFVMVTSKNALLKHQ